LWGGVPPPPRCPAGGGAVPPAPRPPRGGGRARADARALAEEALERVGMEDAAGCFTRDLCAGEKQRVSLARALVNKPVLVLADEPTLGLDPDQALRVLKVLTEACRDGATVLMATHDMEALSVMRGRVLVIHRGRLSDESGPEDVHAS
jgi:ABC-type ATPase involved in cell division